MRVPAHGVCCDKISACTFLVLKSIFPLFHWKVLSVDFVFAFFSTDMW